MYIDFSLIEGGENFELLCEDLVQSMGYKIEEKVSRGPDGGKDIIAVYSIKDPAGFSETHRYLIECKHFAVSNKSVTEEDIGNVVLRMSANACGRYLLITSTVPSEKARKQLSTLSNIGNYKAEVWSKGDLRRLLFEYKDVRDRHVPLPNNEKTLSLIRDAIVKRDGLGKIKRLIVENPLVLPIERHTQKQYGFMCDVILPRCGRIDVVAARADSLGMIFYAYFLGSPYSTLFAENGQPRAEFNDLLRRSCDLVLEVSRPLPSTHSLHYANVTGKTSGGMKESYIERRKEHGLGPYTRINAVIIMGQRVDQADDYDVSIFKIYEKWLTKYDKRNSPFEYTNSGLPQLRIMSYDRLTSDGSVGWSH